MSYSGHRGSRRKLKLQHGQTDSKGLTTMCQRGISVSRMQLFKVWKYRDAGFQIPWLQNWCCSHGFFYCWLLIGCSSQWCDHESCELDVLLGKPTLSNLPLTSDFLMILKGVLIIFLGRGGGRKGESNVLLWCFLRPFSSLLSSIAPTASGWGGVSYPGMAAFWLTWVSCPFVHHLHWLGHLSTTYYFPNGSLSRAIVRLSS